MNDITKMTNDEMTVLYDEMVANGLIVRDKVNQENILRLSDKFLDRASIYKLSDMTTDVVIRTLVKEYNIIDEQALFDYACVLMMMQNILQKQKEGSL